MSVVMTVIKKMKIKKKMPEPEKAKLCGFSDLSSKTQQIHW